MSLNPDTAEQERIAAATRRRGLRLLDRERLTEGAFGASFLLATLALVVAAGAPLSDINVPAALGCMLCLALALHVPFAVGDGYTVPTQLAFIPLLFTMPPALAPFAVVLALGASRMPQVLAGGYAPSRLLVIPGDSWFAIGPAAVLAATQTHAIGDLTLPIAIGLMASQVLVETAAWAVRVQLLGRAAFREQVRELWIQGVDLALTPIGLLTAYAAAEHWWCVFATLPLLGILAVFSREREARMRSLIELNSAYRGTALVLGDVVEADDQYTGEHSRGVVALALEVGEALGLGQGRRRNLEFGALLHDVGKIAVPNEIINKPGKLDPQEWMIIKAHTIEGQKMLDRVGGFMREVGAIVRSHHERWDGGGYPDGLVGLDIPVEARIIAACDSWNAMTTTRSYRPAMSLADATEELQRCSGTQFDPQVVDVLLGLLDAPEVPVLAA